MNKRINRYNSLTTHRNVFLTIIRLNKSKQTERKYPTTARILVLIIQNTLITLIYIDKQTNRFVFHVSDIFRVNDPPTSLPYRS